MITLSPNGEEVKAVPEIIKQASSSPLGIFALMLIILGTLAYIFFKKASVNVKVLIFLSMFVGAVAYGIAITQAANTPLPGPTPDSVVSIAGVVTDENDNWIQGATIYALGNVAPAISDSHGEFHLDIRSTKATVPINLRISKDGYRSVDITVNLPVPNGVSVRLTKTR